MMMLVTIELCQVEAVSTQVKFSKECDKQMVTVCQPQPAYSAGAYTTVQHCKEVRVITSFKSRHGYNFIICN